MFTMMSLDTDVLYIKNNEEVEDILRMGENSQIKEVGETILAVVP